MKGIRTDAEAEAQQLVAAKQLASRVKTAEQKIRKYKAQRYPEKSLVQILRKIREQFGSFGEAVAIAMIRRNKKLEQADELFIAGEEAALLQAGQPALGQNRFTNC